MWSISAHKQFKRCQRQWFYKNIMADGRVKKDPQRIEATRLSKLKTVAAWRGLVVDQVITAYLIPQLKIKQVPTLERVLSSARSIFDKWYEMASTPLQAGQKLQYGLLDIETKGSVDPDALEQAWNEIVTALTNFVNDEELLAELRSADYLLDQRPLWCKVSDRSVKGIPDLVAFWHDRPPVIYDWKVNFYGTLSHEQQLLVYAPYANQMVNVTQILRQYLLHHEPEATRLTEVQLITHTGGHKREYTVTTTKLEDTESFIAYRLSMPVDVFSRHSSHLWPDLRQRL